MAIAPAEALIEHLSPSTSVDLQGGTLLDVKEVINDQLNIFR